MAELAPTKLACILLVNTSTFKHQQTINKAVFYKTELAF